MGNVEKWELEQQELALFLAGVKPAICLDEADPRASISELYAYPVTSSRGGSVLFFQDEGLKEWYLDTMEEFERQDMDDRYVLGVTLGYYPKAAAYFVDPMHMNPWNLVDRGFVNYYGLCFAFGREMEEDTCEWLEATYEIPEYLKETGEYTIEYPHEKLFG